MSFPELHFNCSHLYNWWFGSLHKGENSFIFPFYLCRSKPHRCISEVDKQPGKQPRAESAGGWAGQPPLSCSPPIPHLQCGFLVPSLQSAGNPVVFQSGCFFDSSRLRYTSKDRSPAHQPDAGASPGVPCAGRVSPCPVQQTAPRTAGEAGGALAPVCSVSQAWRHLPATSGSPSWDNFDPLGPTSSSLLCRKWSQQASAAGRPPQALHGPSSAPAPCPTPAGQGHLVTAPAGTTRGVGVLPRGATLSHEGWEPLLLAPGGQFPSAPRRSGGIFHLSPQWWPAASTCLHRSPPPGFPRFSPRCSLGPLPKQTSCTRPLSQALLWGKPKLKQRENQVRSKYISICVCI